MTLVVARIRDDRIAIASDTMTFIGPDRLPMADWTLKSIFLPGEICVSYAGSPELAAKEFQRFRAIFSKGAGRADVVKFFEQSSGATNNDYIVAFNNPARLVTIRNGHQTAGPSQNHWIGDKPAYERFRECERYRRAFDAGRAVHAVLFADEMEGSPASDLFSTMRDTLGGNMMPSAGGFITVVSNRDHGFRHSVYSDVLLDWPDGISESDQISLTAAIDLRATEENRRFSTSQISGGYYNLNAVAFYVLSGGLLVTLHESSNGSITCGRRSAVEPQDVAPTMDQMMGFSANAMALVMSSKAGGSIREYRTSPTQGLGIPLFCELNTLARPG